ncbi:MAG: hypothetical protein U0802_02080 [Candidatus Binatia bacterium]
MAILRLLSGSAPTPSWRRSCAPTGPTCTPLPGVDAAGQYRDDLYVLAVYFGAPSASAASATPWRRA